MCHVYHCWRQAFPRADANTPTDVRDDLIALNTGSRNSGSATWFSFRKVWMLRFLFSVFSKFRTASMPRSPQCCTISITGCH